ncbi:hypothetical protein [Saccharolobus caldissimus]|uniref:Uncharacterized protein n=1 Tax=Saccharolobus caldissimus TaxID=1702097 RepID=A0AAQ4CU07_9CREN|nr:hypothetical protein [Saccharolobus caldissimus]BDB99288.1 hypothetical protein SACC_23050 [Saccharolobus caldissimus]
MIDNLPGVLAIYRFQGGRLQKIKGVDIKINLDKLSDILVENMRIGEQEAKDLKFLEPFRGYAMILDNMGIVFIDDYVIFTDAKKTNWDLLIKSALKGMVMQNG